MLAIAGAGVLVGIKLALGKGRKDGDADGKRADPLAERRAAEWLSSHAEQQLRSGAAPGVGLPSQGFSQPVDDGYLVALTRGSEVLCVQTVGSRAEMFWHTPRPQPLAAEGAQARRRPALGQLPPVRLAAVGRGSDAVHRWAPPCLPPRRHRAPGLHAPLLRVPGHQGRPVPGLAVAGVGTEHTPRAASAPPAAARRALHPQQPPSHAR
jgi:hypothetical protein